MLSRLHNARSLFSRRKSRFVTAELFSDYTRTAQVILDQSAKEIVVRSIRDVMTGGERMDSTMAKKFRVPRQWRFFAGADTARAVTTYAAAKEIRERPQEPIDEGDLDTMVSQTIWKFFDRNRGRIASRMGAAEFDVLLSEAHVEGVRLDGHRVVNPVGFTARTFESHFVQTYLRRDFADFVKRCVAGRTPSGIVELAPTVARALSRGTTHPRFLFCGVTPRTTAVVGVDEGHIETLGTLSWGSAHCAEYFAEHLALRTDVAAEVIRAYLRGACSRALTRGFDALFLDGLAFFIKGIRRYAEQTAARAVYLFAVEPLPPLFFGTQFGHRFPGQLSFHPVTDETIRQSFGYEVRYKKSGAEDRLTAVLLALLECELAPRDERIDRSAGRRVRWLSPL